jgi:hypothetical protein
MQEQEALQLMHSLNPERDYIFIEAGDMRRQYGSERAFKQAVRSKLRDAGVKAGAKGEALQGLVDRFTGEVLRISSSTPGQGSTEIYQLLTPGQSLGYIPYEMRETLRAWGLLPCK